MSAANSTDSMEVLIARLLTTGMVLAASVTALGLILLLIRDGGVSTHDVVNLNLDLDLDLNLLVHNKTTLDPLDWPNLCQIWRRAQALDAVAVIDIGLLILLFTPILRVLLSIVLFSRKGDRLYVCITGSVLAILLFALKN